MSIPSHFFVVDFEFTTFGKKTFGKPRAFFPEIIELGAVSIHAPSFEETEPLQAFVKPRFFPKLTQECIDLTQIYQNNVDSGISFEALLSLMKMHYSPEKTWFVAWGDSDRDVLQEACNRYKTTYPFLFEDYVDLAEEYKLFYHHPRTPSLKLALEERQIQAVGLTHSALDDARNTAQLFADLVKAGWMPRRKPTCEPKNQ